MRMMTPDLGEQIKKLDTVFFADSDHVQGIYEMMSERFKWKGDQSVPLEWFAFQNHVQTVIEKRAEAVPKEFRFVMGDPVVNQGATDALTKWLGKPLFGDQKDFWGRQANWHLYLERTGGLPLALAMEQGVLTVSRKEASDMHVLFESDSIDKVHGYSFEWDEEFEDENQQKQSRHVSEEYTLDFYRRTESLYGVSGRDAGQLIDSQVVTEQANPYGFIPIVYVKNEEIPGSPLGRSGVAPLVEPQLMLNRVLTDIRVSNLFAAQPIYWGNGVMPMSLQQDPRREQAERRADAVQMPGRPSTGILIRPRMFIPVMLNGQVNRIAPSADINALAAEKEFYEAEIYQKGRVTRKAEEELRAMGAAPSGKALLVLNRDGLVYVQMKVGLLYSAYQDLLAKAAVMMGLTKVYDPDQFTLTFPPLELEDPEEQYKKVQTTVVLMQANVSGKPLIPRKIGLKAIKDLGYLPDSPELDAYIDSLPDEEPEVAAAPAIDLTAMNAAMVSGASEASRAGVDEVPSSGS